MAEREHDYRCTPGECYSDCPAAETSITKQGGWGSPGADPVADIKAAMQKMREWTPPPMVISPRAAQAVNQVLERPEGTPISKPDLHRAIDVLYQRATPEEQERMFEYSLELQWRGSYG